MSDQNSTMDILLNEYSFMQKSSELHFTHFMGVFLFWTAIVTIPAGAGVFANLGMSDPSKPVVFGALCVFVTLIGVFLSAKMFDIRRSQIRYLERVNTLRIALWEKYKIEEQTKIVPMGKNVDLVQVAKTDFGMYMALIMSFIHGIIFGVGLWCLLGQMGTIWHWQSISVLVGVILFAVNFGLYFLLIGRKIKVT